jgi:hypothetical protein
MQVSLRVFARAAIVLMAMLALLGRSHAAEEKRVALIIGNGAYQDAPALANPRNDAHDVVAALKPLGFQIVDGFDLDRRGMDSALARFSRLAQDADAALVYYAGHGLQYLGQNYLVPVDAKLEDEHTLPFEMTRLEDILGTLERARGVKILVLDACRNNPFSDRLRRMLSQQNRDFGATRGLAKVERTQGMVIAYATQSNQVAVDGTGRNSPFTAAFLKELPQPDLEVGVLFRRVALAVNKATEGRQTPELSMSLIGEFYFRRGEKVVDNGNATDAVGLSEKDRQQRLRDRLSRLEDEKKRAADELAAIEKTHEGPIERATANDKAMQQAALPPADEKPTLRPPAEPPLESAALVGSIQGELKRLGCYSGTVDRNWEGASTKRALADFTKHASLPTPREPDAAFLSTLKGRLAAVCPLACGPREVARNGVCVAKACPTGSKLDQGACVSDDAAKSVAAKQARAEELRQLIASQRCSGSFGLSQSVGWSVRMCVRWHEELAAFGQ